MYLVLHYFKNQYTKYMLIHGIQGLKNNNKTYM
jgi:hypothetical protein